MGCYMATRSGLACLVVAAGAGSAAGQAPRVGNPAARVAPLDLGEVIRVQTMTVPFAQQAPNHGEFPGFLEVREIRSGLAGRYPARARDEANSLIVTLSDQRRRAVGEERRRTEADLRRLREFLTTLDQPRPAAHESVRPRPQIGPSNDQRIDQLEKEVERLRKELGRVRGGRPGG